MGKTRTSASQLLLFFFYSFYFSLDSLKLLYTTADLPITSQLALRYHPQHYFLSAEHFCSSEVPRLTETQLVPPSECFLPVSWKILSKLCFTARSTSAPQQSLNQAYRHSFTRDQAEGCLLLVSTYPSTTHLQQTIGHTISAGPTFIISIQGALFFWLNKA